MNDDNQTTENTKVPQEPEEEKKQKEEKLSETVTEPASEEPSVDETQDEEKPVESNEEPSETTEPSEPTEPSQPSEKEAAQAVDQNPEVIAAEEKTPTEETKEEVTEGPTDIKTSKKDPKGAHWYVVHTYSGHEAKVAATLKQRIESQRLADKILEILVPTQEKIEIREGKKSTVREKLFPGYILIKMILDDATWLAVRTTPGITSFVGNANKPTPLPESEVGTIQRFMTMEAPKFKAAFTVGEAVKITDGPFSDFLGSISEIDDEKGKVKVLVSIFGRETPVELDFLQIAKL